MMRTPFLHLASVAALRMFFVSGVSGMWTVMKSARRQQRGEIVRQFHLQAAGAALHEVGIVGDDVHAEGDGAARDLAADAAHADDAERLAAKLRALERFAVPLARDHRGVRLRNFARERKQQREGVLRRRDRVAAGRVHHHDAALRGRLDIDVVDADAGAADDLQPRRRGQRLGRHLRRAADDQRVEVADAGDQLVFLETCRWSRLENGGSPREQRCLWVKRRQRPDMR